MKKVMTIIGAILFTVTILTSCSESDEKTNEDVIDIYSDDDTQENDTNDESLDSEDSFNEDIESNESNNCDQFIKDYEEFVNSYVVIIKKMKANPSDISIMSEYAEMSSKATTMQSGANDCTDSKYATKLSQLASKMANAAAGM